MQGRQAAGTLVSRKSHCQQRAGRTFFGLHAQVFFRPKPVQGRALLEQMAALGKGQGLQGSAGEQAIGDQMDP